MNRRIPTMLTAMTPFPYWIEVTAGIAEAKAMMAEHGIRHLPVTEGHELVGVVSERDILRAQTPELGAQPDDELSVGDAFVAEVFTVDVTEPLDSVLMHMWEHRMGAVLVLRAGKLAGIFTAADACRLYAESLRGEGDVDDDIA